LVVGVLGVAPGLGGCGGGSTPPADSPTGAAGEAKSTNTPDKATDEALAAQIAKDQGAEQGDKAAGDDNAPKTDEARKNELYKLVKDRRAAVLDQCIKPARNKNRKIGTDLTITFALNSDGTFKEPPGVVKDRSDISDPKVIACALDIVKAIKFPAHPKGMESSFVYPFKFEVVRAKQ
jgi:hypothetical protein